MSKEQCKGIHDIVNDQGFAIRRFQTRSAIWKFFDERINTAKLKDEVTFLMLSVLEVKIFQYGFLQEHKVSVKNYY